MKRAFNKAQFRALMALRGTPQQVHVMLMSGQMTPRGGSLTGSAQDFDDLIAHISEDIANDMHPPATTAALISACQRLDPGCADWLGV